MSPDGGSTIRADLNTTVIEAAENAKHFIGGLVLPAFGVDAKSGTYPKLTKTVSELMNADVTNRAPGTSYGETTRQWTTDTYDTQDRGLEEAIDDTHKKDLARFFSVEQTVARLLTENIMRAQEQRVQAAIQNNTTFPGTNSTVAYTEANIATINFPLDMMAALERVADNGEEADTIVMSADVYNRIRRSTLLTNFLVGQDMPSANITPNAIAQAFSANGIKQVLVGRARYNSAKKGQSYAAGKIWNNTYIWVGKVGSGDPMSGGVGRTFVWNAEGGLYVTESYRDEKRRSDVLRVRQHTIEKITNSAAGTMITTQYA